ncbi:MAG TPA: N-acetylglucosamine-6-phosphate deacetylase [Xanthobacteraceae bacterium]|nr:N-acetylglucosamine-6-phosphate deacetylase [Xanthobacteraceae bacterium]
MRKHAVAARRLFDGETVHDNAAAIIDGSRIAAVVARADVPATLPVRQLPENLWLAPGFIDIQVNGGGDALFNDAPTPDTIRKIVTAHRRFGTTALLPTLISDSAAKMRAALAAVDALVGAEPAVLGIHLEGPFLSPEKRGVHDARAIRRPTDDDIAMIAAPRPGVTLVTLAPEQVPAGMITRLSRAGVRVALGHSMATYAQTIAAMTEGLTGFTHLFNAMRPLDSRDGGPIAAALDSAAAWYGLIVDGIHVAPAMLRLALRGVGRPILVTDAMPPVGGSRSSFTLNGETIVVRDGRCATADGTLAGAYLDMAAALRNCVRLLDLPLTDALRFASAHPAQFLGLGDRLGRLAPGYRADMVALDAATIEVRHSWVAGEIE